MAAIATNADERLEARITAEQKKLLKEAATLQGVTLTDFVISSAYEAAIRTLEARHVIELSQRDQQVFVDSLMRPKPPNAELRRAWSRYGPSAGSTRGTRRIRRTR